MTAEVQSGHTLAEIERVKQEVRARIWTLLEREVWLAAGGTKQPPPPDRT